MDLLILLKAKLSTPDQVHKKTPSLGWGFILFLSVDPERFELFYHITNLQYFKQYFKDLLKH